MVQQLKWPWLGVAIPTAIITFISYNAHYFILSNFVSLRGQFVFEFSVTMIWFSYLSAIFTNPGRPPSISNNSELNKNKGNIRRTNMMNHKKYCHKCNNIKPERTHHCKTCNQCVLMMDHHCPWTLNCVGYKNFPHFIRFLLWIIISTSQLNWYFFKRVICIWNLWNNVNISFQRTEFIFLTILIPFNLFIWLTIFILLIRCINNQILHGRTQIETWELDRLETLFYHKKLIPLLIQRLWDLYPPENNAKRREEANILLRKYKDRKVRFESIINFPYDISIWKNWEQSLGPIYLLLWPFGKPRGDGISFSKNDISQYEENLSIEDLMLTLPWPPDGGRKQVNLEDTDVEQIFEDGEFVVRNRPSKFTVPSQRDSQVSGTSIIIDRSNWVNEWGEKLQDFGVDVDEE